MNGIFNYILSAFALGMTFLFGSTGEIIIEKVGHLNLGIPGVMCMGAAGGCLTLKFLYPINTAFPKVLVDMYKSVGLSSIISESVAETISVAITGVIIVSAAIIATFVSGMLMGGIFSFLAVSLHSNQNVIGLAMTTFGVGAMKYIMAPAYLSPLEYLYAKEYFRFPFNNFHNSFCYCGVMFFLAMIIAFTAAWILRRTCVGLHLRAVGESPATADAAGINVTLYKYMATCIGCGIAALGGLYYVIDFSGSQEGYLSIEPFGWLAIALVIFALWKPNISVIGSMVFGVLFLAGSQIATLGITVSISTTPLLKMLPYVVTIIVLIITSIKDNKSNQPPASLGVDYFREDR